VLLQLALIALLLLAITVAYLASFSAPAVRAALGRGFGYDLPSIALLVSAVFVGAAFVLILSALRDIVRSYRNYRSARPAHRAERVDEIYRRGVEAQLAGAASDAVEAYREVLRRDPAHSRASVRLAELARQRGDLEAAIEHRQQALRGSPEQPDGLLALAEDLRRSDRAAAAGDIYRRLLARDRDHRAALRGLRDVAIDCGNWAAAVSLQGRLLRDAPPADRVADQAQLAALHYELGRSLLGDGQLAPAGARFKEALRVRADFLPAALLLGDAQLQAGDSREALRTWERALETEPAVPVLERIAHLHRAAGRPARIVQLYQEMAARHPESLAVAFGLSRVYFELAMLDEASEQLEKMEVRTPDLPAVHAYLGATFERRGQLRQALDEYRRALGFPRAFEWPHRCAACGSEQAAWFDRCPSCKRWNTSRA
jgi:lipopolysaccharide biosynthesis regulator YciM